VAQVLGVATLQLGDPIALFILVEARNLSGNTRQNLSFSKVSGCAVRNASL
jgi:hypothetical protein